ncbi:GNAT family N-acetyltransferase [Streptomyces xylophagus]|uniref:GNAT family N-acetyltransferase n=1 Tax=Streptomyces xylophagus TaxID=285514 RepID=UPI00068A6176|nr:GNAT family N-acetyltransferase [Streptomyces xylophagus]
MPPHPPIHSVHDLQPQLSNLCAYWLGWDADDTTDSDLPVYRTGLPHPLLNGVLRFRGESLDDALSLARKRLDGTPHLWWVGDDSNPGLVEQLVARGGTLTSTLPVMAVDLGKVADATVPGLEISPVVDRPGLAEYVTTYSEVFGIPHDVIPSVVDAEANYSTARSDVVRFVGRVNGQVVGTAQLSMSHGVAGIYWVATLEAHRKRGIAGALTTAALLAGRERGLLVGSLQASRRGESVYRGLGFETVGHVHHVAVQYGG